MASQIKVSLSDASASAEKQVGNNSHAVAGHLGVVNGYLVYNSQAPYVATQFAGKFGFLDIDITNGNPHTKLTGTFYGNKGVGGGVEDQFTIEKEIKGKKSA
jgi:hypothetical protein